MRLGHLQEPRFKAAAAKTPTLVSPVWLACDVASVAELTLCWLLTTQGPGHYNTDTVESDWNRPTHNISIATEMELAMLH